MRRHELRPSEGLRRRQVGAATVEAAVSIPVLVILFFGILYAHAHADARQRARIEARRCTWEHALEGCGEVPNGCEALAHSSERAPADASADSAARRVIDGARSSSLLGRVPFFGEALDGLLGPATELVAERTVRRAGFEGSAAARFHLLCNAKPTSPSNAVRDTFWELTEFDP